MHSICVFFLTLNMSGLAKGFVLTGLEPLKGNWQVSQSERCLLDQVGSMEPPLKRYRESQASVAGVTADASSGGRPKPSTAPKLSSSEMADGIENFIRDTCKRADAAGVSPSSYLRSSQASLDSKQTVGDDTAPSLCPGKGSDDGAALDASQQLRKNVDVGALPNTSCWDNASNVHHIRNWRQPPTRPDQQPLLNPANVYQDDGDNEPLHTITSYVTKAQLGAFMRLDGEDLDHAWDYLLPRKKDRWNSRLNQTEIFVCLECAVMPNAFARMSPFDLSR